MLFETLVLLSLSQRRGAPGSGGAGAPRVSRGGAADLIEQDNDR